MQQVIVLYSAAKRKAEQERRMSEFVIRDIDIALVIRVHIGLGRAVGRVGGLLSTRLHRMRRRRRHPRRRQLSFSYRRPSSFVFSFRLAR